MPIFIMTGQSLPSTVFYLAMLAALTVLVQHRRTVTLKPFKTYGWLILWMSTPILAVLFSASWHGSLAGSSLESGIRYLFGILLPVWALSYLKPTHIRTAFWGYVAAALAASAVIISLSWPDWHRPNTSHIYNAVGYGNLTALLTTLTLISIRWQQTPWPRIERLIKLSVAALAMVAFLLTQTRSGWIAVPVFCLIGAILISQEFRPARILSVALLILAGVFTLFISSADLRQRAVTGYHEVISCTGEQATTDNSLCIRLQLWRAAWGMFLKRPIAGNGDTRTFKTAIQNESLPEGIVSEHVAAEWGEPHNDLLLALASFGAPGGLALLAVFLAPAWMFVRRLAFSHPPDVRTAAAMGLVTCLGLPIFGLSETMMHSMRTVGFYSLTVGLLLVLSDIRLIHNNDYPGKA